MPINPTTTQVRMPRRVTVIATLSVLLVGGAAIGVARAAIPDSGTGVIHGCQNKATGIVRVVDPTLSGNLAHCITSNGPLQELAFIFNQTGPAGPAGHAGATGATGATGAIGAIGATGATGPKGDAGSKGDKGDQGLPGDTGLPGVNGTNGVDGKDGLPGKDGTNGVDGKDGHDGLPGATGPAGPVGPVGPAGTGGSGRTVLMAKVTTITGTSFLVASGDATQVDVDIFSRYHVTFAPDLTYCAVAVTAATVAVVYAAVTGPHTVSVELFSDLTGNNHRQGPFSVILAC